MRCPADIPLTGPRSSGASSRSPQCRSNPVSANAGGGRSGSPSGRSLGHSSIGSASSRSRPPPRTHWSSSTRSSAGWAGDARPAAARARPDCRHRPTADRLHLVASLEPAERRRPAAPPGRNARRTPTAGWSAASASGAARPAGAPAGARRSTATMRRDAAIKPSASTATRAAAHWPLFSALTCPLLSSAVARPGATPSSASGSLGSALAIGHHLRFRRRRSSPPDRLIAIPEQDEQKGEGKPGQADADALRCMSA